MQYVEFITAVEREAGLEPVFAQRAVVATLETLSERMSAGGSQDVARRLPIELQAVLESDDDAEAFGMPEFLRRIADREGVVVSTAQDHARAVFAALGQAVPPAEIADLASGLSDDFGSLIAEARAQSPSERGQPAAQPSWTVSADEFQDGVARRAGLDREGARRATDAVFHTLGERVTRGEIEDIAAQLPAELRPPLRRGDAESHGAARPMDLASFLRLVAEREGVTPDEAREHARAVFATLRDTITEKEFSDMAAQLPKDYAALLGRD
jgi:uncharacterized protein (DUF2267 family)